MDPETRRPEVLSARYRLFRWTVMQIVRLLFGFELRAAGDVPEKGPLILAANHTQYLDPFYVCLAVPRRVQWMAKKEIFVSPFDRLFRLLGAFPVDRKKGDRAALRTALELLGQGWALGMFPEGTHRREGVDRAAKSGAIMLAARSRARVLPVYISPAPGLRERLRGEKLRAYVGEPVEIDASLRGREAYRRAADELLREIYGLPERYGGGR